MKKTFIIGLIAAALGFTACSSEDDLNVNNNQNNLTIFPFGQGEAEAKGIGKVKWVQLWENGPRFAEFNVGATSATATQYGGYYGTATNFWGSNWRMPTKEEFDTLLAKCDVKWIDGIIEIYNIPTVKGLLCQGKDAYSSNSVFLPAAGRYFHGGVYDQDEGGYYWSSTSEGFNAYYLYFDYWGHQYVSSDSRLMNGFSVRAVLAE